MEPKQQTQTMKNGAKREPKRAKEPSMTPFRNRVEQDRTSIEKGCRKGVRGASLGKPLEDRNQEKIIKNTFQKTFKTQSWENIRNDDKTMPKGNQKSSIF